jgi:hypothetical protein
MMPSQLAAGSSPLVPRRFRKRSVGVALDDERERKPRLCSATDGAVCEYPVDGYLAAGMDEEEQPARHASAVPADHRKAWWLA